MLCDSPVLIKEITVEEILYILAKTVSVCLGVVSFAMFMRVILSFFVNPMESRLYELALIFTEPFVAPIRALMVRLNIGQDSPIDWSFSITYIIIMLLEGILPAI